jgi:hypothetical protein
MNSVDYVRVRDRRPLYFLGAVNEQIVSQRWGSVSALRDEINNFRGAVEASGSGNPYIALTGDRAKIGEIARALGGDAITMYAVSAPLRSAPYDALVHVAEEAWNALEDQGLPVVPTVMTGWDRRPRIERPVPWERFQRPGVGADEYFDAGRPQQIARHLQEGLSWLARRPQEKRAPAILIYAWNENDEGGWLIPTLPCDTKRIEALHAMLSPNNSAPNPNCNF